MAEPTSPADPGRRAALAAGLAGTGWLAACAAPLAQAQAPADAAEAEAIAGEAFIWGYPLVVMERTRLRSLFQAADGRVFRVNEQRHVPQLLNWRSRRVVMPNSDTLYSTAWLDLRLSALVLSVPALAGATDRYYSCQLMDWYTNTVGYVGSRSTGRAASTTLIVGPDWRGPPPAGMRLLRCPTSKAWLLTRVLVDDPRDLSGPRALQQAMRLEPLQAAGISPPAEPRPLKLESPQEPASTGLGFFDEVCAQLVGNPPPAAEAPLLRRFARLGITPGGSATAAMAQAGTAAAALRGLQAANADLEARAAKRRTATRGWTTEVVGAYGSNFALRALTARTGLAALTSEEAQYFHLASDADGQPYTSEPGFTLTLRPAALPRIDGFWSLSVYSGIDYFPAESAIDRFSISDRTPGIRRDADGGYTVTVSTRMPDAGPANWIPAPAGPIIVSLRIYVGRGSAAEYLRALPLPQRIGA